MLGQLHHNENILPNMKICKRIKLETGYCEQDTVKRYGDKKTQRNCITKCGTEKAWRMLFLLRILK